MSQEKHLFDAAAEQLEALRDAPVAEQGPSPDYWELCCAADAEVVGDYPQALLPEDFDRGETDGLGPDGFPTGPIPVLELKPSGRCSVPTCFTSRATWNP